MRIVSRIEFLEADLERAARRERLWLTLFVLSVVHAILVTVL